MPSHVFGGLRKMQDSQEVYANLVNMLDAIGVPEKLGTHSMSNLFNNDSELLYSGSIVRYPVLKDGENYSGSSPVLHKRHHSVSNVSRTTTGVK